MEKKDILKNAMSELSAFDAKIKRLVIIEELKITNECYRNWIKGINVPSRKKREALNVIFGKPIYIN
ncbi:MAG: hypothetical protein PHI42_06345 [Paludibacteraceae bacterium]|nr:hypothetical protein [Paludibacteraceae bacterium]